MDRYEQTICWDCQNATGGCSWSKVAKALVVRIGPTTLERRNSILLTTKRCKRDKAYAYRSAPGYKIKKLS